MPADFGKDRCAGSMMALLLFEKDAAPVPDGLLHCFAELVQEPREGHFEAHVAVRHLNVARSGLAKGPHAEIHPVAGPFFLVDAQNRKVCGGLAKRGLDPAQGFILTELVSDGDDEGFRHGRLPELRLTRGIHASAKRTAHSSVPTADAVG
jgi:hypothetical protein